MKKEKTPEELIKEGRKLKRRVDKGVKVRGKKVIEKKKSGSNKTKTVTQEGKPTKVKKKKVTKKAPTKKQVHKRLLIGSVAGGVIGGLTASKISDTKGVTAWGATAGVMAGSYIADKLTNVKKRKVTRTKTVDGVNKKAAKKVVKSKMKTMRQKRRR
jgi:outer membrane lipoprotein SlyB